MKYSKNIIETIGQTPLVQLNNIVKDLKAKIFVKLEYLNPGGSMKDRIAIIMIEDAEKKGLLKKGGTIVEPTSGNTGVGLAIVAAIKGYKVIFTMSDKMSKEKEDVLKAYGATVVRCPADVEADNPIHYINVAKRIAHETKAYFPNQYHNSANPLAHYKTTGPEIWKDTEGKITHLIVPVGTGGTISGTAKYLKEKNKNIRVIGADPKGSLLHHYFYKTQGKAHSYLVEGPGEDFMPLALDMSVIDDIFVVTDKDSFITARELVSKEGIFAGGSSGMAVYVALNIAKSLSSTAIVVVILPDSGRSYVSKFYNDDWMKAQNLF
ncbi:cystathionine beta-synthase [Candidatus Roizmanbacteria bacterium RIFCSPHIGHO2_02_FULL_37_13b]|uniref:Cystathionine beta-synthase n=1 Tax=Candidatus Roizmanbacteria bacterium RIFCSPLOWO2_02_FULL_36_11 TaxID=1802071 RepID=A0A1F7JII1_9BACT|nr:MAG: cystathionine beta-synthase [Candidatus Roizmanbacteria bacterium RIFCSPHIGHO2_02_FULL_37_13b]OGK55419.1 MAG: cystathionine beta-synthase [Candidatus Roizmanbacteria bacterium RIFCSPLOWO2_02_FULL_36_11]